jgi:hypothetical protein
VRAPAAMTVPARPRRVCSALHAQFARARPTSKRRMPCDSHGARACSRRMPRDCRERRAKNDKRTLYVGGLDDDVDLAVLRAAFIPFGEVVSRRRAACLSACAHECASPATPSEAAG